MKKPRKETTLYAYWSRKERDLMYCYPKSKADGHLLHAVFGYPGSFSNDIDLLKELESRGYDTTTIKFSIKLKDSKESK
jgi:hypothetical protein